MSIELFDFNTKWKKNNKHTYKNYNDLLIDLPFRMLIIGASKSGKTTLLINLIKLINAWKKIYIIARETSEPLYEGLANLISKVENRVEEQILFMSNKLSDLPPLDEFDESNPSLIIFDDLINSSNKEFNEIKEIYLRGRKRGISSIFISQSYFDIPSMIRKNAYYIVLKKVTSNKDFTRIVKEYLKDISSDDLKELYDKIIHENKLSFLMIDVDHGEELLFRHNFRPICL